MVFVKACMIFPGKWEPQSPEIIEGIFQVGNIFLTSFFSHCEGINFVLGKGFNPSGKHANKNKCILLALTRWQLKEVQLQVFKCPERENLRPLGKNSFSRIRDLTSQTLLVFAILQKSLYPCIFIIRVILNAIWWVKEHKRHKMCFIRKLRRTKWLSWVSHNPDCTLNLQPLLTYINFSDSGADYCHVTMTSGWQKFGNQGPFFFKQNGFYSHVSQSYKENIKKT